MDAIWSSLIAGIAGVVAGAVPVWAMARRQPSRHIQDTVSIVGASGELVEHLRDEVGRLSTEAAEAKRNAERAWEKVSELSEQAVRLQVRVIRLEQAVRNLGGDPAAA